uniref:Uncharacterized protein n=1 Tax=Lygus hesperus TaxID=30085 RepID=A0A0K8S5A6_LYGHE
MDNLAGTTALPDHNESSTEPTETERHQSSGLLPGNQMKLPGLDNVDSKYDTKFEKLNHPQRPIPYTEVTRPAGAVEDDSLSKTTQNYDYFNDYVHIYQQPLLDKVPEKPVRTDHESLTEPPAKEILPWRQQPTDLSDIPSANPAQTDWYEESPETAIQSSKHRPGGQMKLSDPTNIEGKNGGRFRELHHSQEPILHTSHEMEKPDDSMVLHFERPVEESLRETTQLDAHSSKPSLPVDIIDKTSEKATQTDHSVSQTEPIETKSQSSGLISSEPLNDFQQPSDDFWFKLYEERKTPSPIVDIENHGMSVSVPETSGDGVWSNERSLKENEDNKPTTSRSIFAKFWDKYGW